MNLEAVFLYDRVFVHVPGDAFGEAELRSWLEQVYQTEEEERYRHAAYHTGRRGISPEKLKAWFEKKIANEAWYEDQARLSGNSELELHHAHMAELIESQSPDQDHYVPERFLFEDCYHLDLSRELTLTVARTGISDNRMHFDVGSLRHQNTIVGLANSLGDACRQVYDQLIADAFCTASVLDEVKGFTDFQMALEEWNIKVMACKTFATYTVQSAAQLPTEDTYPDRCD